jgi:hypothetical protein
MDAAVLFIFDVLELAGETCALSRCSIFAAGFVG